MSEKPIRIVTHSGAFQPDDVFATATLKIFCGDQVEIVRSRDPEIISTGDYVVDVGNIYDPARNRFDHHQLGGAGIRENGIPYSAFGLVWKHFGVRVAGDETTAEEIEKKLVQAIDADDNGVEMYQRGIPDPYGIENLIYGFMPTWAEHDRDLDDSFLEAVEVALRLLNREIRHSKDKQKATAFVEKAYQEASDKRIIVLDVEYPTTSVLSQHPEPLFTIKPDRQNPAWMIKAVQVSKDTFQHKKLFPESWAGKRDGELQKVTGISDAFFCHKDRWVAGARSKEGAIALAKLAVEAV